jgi:hypothetical protein
VALTFSDALTTARSQDWEKRVDAARALVAWVGDARVDAALLLLLDDPDNTAPVLAAAEGLLASSAPEALRLFAVGWSSAWHQSRDWMADALRAALGSGMLERGALELLLHDDDETVRTAARSMCEWARP